MVRGTYPVTPCISTGHWAKRRLYINRFYLGVVEVFLLVPDQNNEELRIIESNLKKLNFLSFHSDELS